MMDCFREIAVSLGFVFPRAWHNNAARDYMLSR